MIPGLQPSRPKPPQRPALPTYAHEQRRAAHSSSPQTSQPPSSPINPARPRIQIEAMPPFGPPHTPATFFTPLYDSAIRHPVFFTQNLKKPPFPIPQNTSQGWNPVASGYVIEQRATEAAGKAKL
ncbi:uncharacterized protein K460DRAFT_335763 [Cucurbitaria berberidis CBS 394.84]|uniref:Uncharacterized protein n=1 Tax=Cucurbitaria berberidis CBS 394.84 TaxID=1168544 RepID=A0A9P4L9N8_9PLEO|nr:uncharacterized protein K460DRAFT_335763 [Cucurbitaria berberidis CBS 394.84]KAF1846608.1 hypothetical protein K460DRAFT_335763 [Cucurbitaria berberidis CBS 394.84]